FGLSQMHQLRGRVGRGQHKSYCLLLSDNPSQEARTRLSILERVSDGFDLAEEDLGLRGPGDYIGTRQSGFEELQVATLSDMDILSAAREEARSLVASDPALKKREHEQLAAALREYLSGRTAEFS
ncbi:MAG: DNA helicase RecG, partial [Chloroflexota bacterium]